MNSIEVKGPYKDIKPWAAPKDIREADIKGKNPMTEGGI